MERREIIEERIEFKDNEEENKEGSDSIEIQVQRRVTVIKEFAAFFIKRIWDDLEKLKY